MGIYHAVSQGRNWTRYERPDVANTEGTLVPAAHPAAPPEEAQAYGAEKRSRPANVYSVRRSRGRPQPFWVRTSLAPAPGNVVSMHCSSACEVLTRDKLMRLQATTSVALAT